MRSQALEEKRTMALKMRQDGMTYNEIVSKLGVAKSTLAGWVRNIFPPEIEEKIKKIAEKKYREKTLAWAKYRSNLIKEIETKEQQRYAKQIKNIAKRDLFFLGLGLYWAEGGKKDRYRFLFCNSDPFLNKVIMKFLYTFLKIRKSQIKIQMMLYKHIHEQEARNYWSKTLGLSSTNFNKASYVLSPASKRRRPQNRLPYGTIQIILLGKKYANMIKGWIQGLEKNFVKQAGVV